MREYSLDNIVRKYLQQEGLTIHDYVECLSLATDCLRELNFDTLRTVKSSKLPVNSYKAVALPADFVDWIKISYARGQYVVEMTMDNRLNRMNNLSNTGQKIPYEVINADESINYSLLDVDATYFNNNVAETSNSFKILKERGEIQLDNRCDAEYVILDYIGDGLDTNADTQINPQAVSTINAYIAWKRSPNRHNVQSPEGFNFFNSHRLLRGRLNDLSLLDIIRSKEKGYTQTIKP